MNRYEHIMLFKIAVRWMVCDDHKLAYDFQLSQSDGSLYLEWFGHNMGQIKSYHLNSADQYTDAMGSHW
jgi:hypothetical protein